ncbi:MAG: response regulator [Clostridium sp.]|nr:response regulator [Clostridium sp.]
MIRRFILSILLIASALPWWGAFAQLPHNYHFSHLKSADGLPHQQVEALAFDRMGRLWVGTRNGLACYDGYSFKTYYRTPGDSTSLPYNFVKRLLVSSDNTLWIGSERGLCRYRPESNDFKRYPEMSRRVSSILEAADGKVYCFGDLIAVYDPAADCFRPIDAQPDSYAVGAAISPDGRIYVSTNNGINIIDPASGQRTVMDPDIYADFLNGADGIIPLAFDRGGHLWIGRNGHGVMSVDLLSGNRRIYDDSELPAGTVRAISEDRAGMIWLGTEGGLRVIDPATGHISVVRQDLVNSNRLNDNAIYCIEPDAAGNLWIGTYFGGINVLKNSYSNFMWVQPGYDGQSLRGKAVRRLAEPVRGQLWLATEDGGINLMDLQTGVVSQFDRIPATGVNVHELYYDPDSREMWIGTFRNGLFRYDLSSGSSRRYTAGGSGRIPSDAVFCMARQTLPSGRRRLWVGTTQGLRWYDPETDSFRPTNYAVLDGDFIYTLLADHSGNLWVGTVNNGLLRIDVASGEVRTWNNLSGKGLSSLDDHYVTTLFEDSGGRIFVGTNTGGLHYIDPKTHSLHSFADGARRFGTICMITQDAARDLWVSTSSGLFRIDGDNLGVRQFTVADGLPENQFNFSSALLASDGRLYFGTVNGLVSFLPEEVGVGGKPQDVHLWRLVASNREIAPGDPDGVLDRPLDDMAEIDLDYEMSRTFSIDYGIVNPGAATAASYQVWLDGVDRGWRDVGSLRQFSAMELAPGIHRLRLRSATNPDDWDRAPVRELLIRISPPWYLSVWAFLAYLLLLAVAVWFAVRYTRERVRQKEAMKLARMEKEKSDELNRDKMEFFTIISHELKTPLSLILAPLKFLSHNESLSDTARKRLGIAITNTNKMVGMIDELVIFNRVETGNFQFYLQKGNPLTMIEDLTDYFRESAAEKNITVNVRTENNGEEVWFSTTYLERIVNNLMSNAVKYTSEGGTIDVRAAIVEEDDRIYLSLEVRDNGIGIAPEETTNIFRKYYQTRRGYNTDHSGWGIGLATVRKLVEAHKGSISVDSVMGEGSTFRVRLLVSPEAFDPASVNTETMAKTPEQSYLRSGLPESATSSRNATRSPERTSILLVEDNPELLAFLSDEFSANYNVYTATNGLEALKVAEENPIDIVVSDVMMPEMDGIELCAKLKGNLATSHIPVILLTAKTDDISVMQGYESGAEAYVAKPFDPQILELRVRNILRARRKFLRSVMEAGETPDTTATEDTPQFTKFDKDFMTRINTLIEENIDNSQFSIADITREFGISRSLLHTKMKSFVNCSMTDYIRRRRIERACRLLREGYNVSETAYRTGFSDPNYFSKVFKKEIGMTPTEFTNDRPSPNYPPLMGTKILKYRYIKGECLPIPHSCRRQSRPPHPATPLTQFVVADDPVCVSDISRERRLLAM